MNKQNIQFNLTKDLVAKLILNFFLFVFFILTLIFGIFEGTWYIQEDEYSEILNIVWIYGLFNYPIIGTYIGLGFILNILLSFFFSLGIIIQIIYDKGNEFNFKIYMSLILTFLSLLASLFIYNVAFTLANAFYIHDTFYEHYIQYSKNILPGFYFGLISVLLIFIKYIILKERINM